MSDFIDPDGWRKATYSNGQGNCTEVGQASGTVLVRDTKDRGTGPVLRVSPDAWERLTTSIKR